MRYCGHFLIKAEGGAKNYKRDTLYLYPGDPLPFLSCIERVTESLSARLEQTSESLVTSRLLGTPPGSSVVSLAHLLACSPTYSI